jgi:hypothetical protein
MKLTNESPETKGKLLDLGEESGGLQGRGGFDLDLGRAK